MYLSSNKKRPKYGTLFVSVIISWCTIADVKITLPDDPEADVKEIGMLINLIVRTDVEQQVMVFCFLIHDTHVTADRESPKTLKFSSEGMVVNRLFANSLSE